MSSCKYCGIMAVYVLLSLRIALLPRLFRTLNLFNGISEESMMMEGSFASSFVPLLESPV